MMASSTGGYPNAAHLLLNPRANPAAKGIVDFFYHDLTAFKHLLSPYTFIFH